MLSNICKFKVTCFWKSLQTHLLVNKLMLLKVKVCCSAQSGSSLCFWHPVPMMWREIQGRGGEQRLSGYYSGRWETCPATSDRHRLLHISILMRRCWCLIAVVWTAALQLSQDRCRYLFLHANKTGASYPPGRCWRHAKCLQHINTSMPAHFSISKAAVPAVVISVSRS